MTVPTPPLSDLRSWGLPGPFAHHVVALERLDALQLPAGDCWLAHGNGRSYGDVALNIGHTLVHTRWLDRYLAFDEASGELTCEAGVTLARIVRDFLPRGWFLPVVPGTRFVTVGGAIANDVHGKNHHAMGSFGDHVSEIGLQRSDGTRIVCSPQHEAGWFAATVGGLGLTGLITHARLRLRRVPHGWMSVHAQRFRGLDEFFERNAAAEAAHEYTVSWIDCLSGGDAGARGLRGVLLAGDHAPADAVLTLRGQPPRMPPEPAQRSVPLTPPLSLINPLSLRAFNALYYARAPRDAQFLQHLWAYFWPLDALLHWNRIYGPRGLLQYQFVVPPAQSREVIAEVLTEIHRAGSGSFLAVLKTFGTRPAPGRLSFARPGLTLALDFPNQPALRGLFARLDAIVQAAGGALYPAKDALGSPALFHAAYPAWQDFARWRDPAISSTFVRRMEGRS